MKTVRISLPPSQKTLPRRVMELIKLAGSAWKIFKWITYVSYMNPPV
jgi:hypothetical protein